MTRQTSNAMSLSLCLMMVIISVIVHPTLGYVSFIQLVICISCTSLLCALETVVWFYDVYRMWVLSLILESVLRVFFIPATTANDLRLWRISIPDLIHYIIFLILEKKPVFIFRCWVLNKGTTGTICITSLVWRGPWLWIEPGTSRTRSQHSTTRLS